MPVDRPSDPTHWARSAGMPDMPIASDRKAAPAMISRIMVVVRIAP
jgi:hypothetical protein